MQTWLQKKGKIEMMVNIKKKQETVREFLKNGKI